MKQKLLILSLAFMGCLISKADGFVLLQKGTAKGYFDNGHDNEMPVVTFDDLFVKISSDTLIHNMQVVIKDKAGNIMYNNNIMVKPSESTLKEYFKGLETVDNTNGQYSGEVLKLVNGSNLDSGVKTNLQKAVIVGNASSQLWIAK